MVQALEQIKTGSREEVEDGLQLLKHANEQCTSLGDAWYYRSLFERKLGHAPLADYSLKNAQMLGAGSQATAGRATARLQALQTLVKNVSLDVVREFAIRSVTRESFRAVCARELR